MHYVTADDALVDRLRGIVEPVEIRDASGKVLGKYTPVLSPEEAALYARAEELFDWEEVERVAQTEHHGCTIEQVMERLRSLERPG